MGNYFYKKKFLENLESDVCRFSQLHSWYKHLPINIKNNYFAIPLRGEQITHPIHGQPKSTDIHWHFVNIEDINEYDKLSDKFKGIIKKYPITLNAFLSKFANISLVIKCNYLHNNADIWTWMKKEYPNQYKMLELILNKNNVNTSQLKQRFDELYFSKQDRKEDEKKQNIHFMMTIIINFA